MENAAPVGVTVTDLDNGEVVTLENRQMEDRTLGAKPSTLLRLCDVAGSSPGTRIKSLMTTPRA
ncbi:MAG: hypothetical protein JWO91_3233 [Acidobacteriaceae bacterium]|nr:hypothetical protein [Acidobacteriaceae bacterium]